ncbi:hypothetical protein BU24DRAFT_423765 [Aaosphaeria arxii CBS 175.79]|uniref:Uncharacterized protein n=1 Tax=Aaosphaeria arxii CBS 175.79 TaxID=1450172 RepID=A0A6A5XNP1_9PLEO|nr:uncharacterized protein BU24DRAFT_423765 [Aaosphaeria arxii CBS 175.79]KAF2014858.1 hypothetical protein BU24DRAFT_423765 [Aaosphaeria arxii CBS 175.79]
MAIQKKHGKGRLDKWYKLAKEKGYRARAAFKLIQLNKKYNFLDHRCKVVIDLCAAPGSWCQVASEVMPPNSLIIGVDLAPIKPIPRCITFQNDITTASCRQMIRQHIKTLKADVVLHDGAPNVGASWVHDAFSQAELVLQSLKLAVEFLREGGTFVTKVFRSKDYNSLLWVFNQLFAKVEATKPPSSRNVSAEIFVVARGFKAPKHLDPKFLDARHVFAELAAPAPNNEAKVFNPEVKKRKREGYEEGDWTQFKEAPVSEFIQTADPIDMLGTMNKLSFDQKPNGDIAIATIAKLPETTQEIRDCCADLKVLGRSDFKRLLKWRLRVREIFGFSTKKKTEEDAAENEEVAEIESMDEELKIQEEMERLKEQESRRKRKDRRAANERKQKEIIRMQLGISAPMDIGLEQSGPNGEDSIFDLKKVDQAGALDKFGRGRMTTYTEQPKVDDSTDDDSDASSDDEEDRLDRELDNMYNDYVENRSARDAKYRAKRARKQDDDGEWHGFSDEDKEQNSDGDLVEDDASSISGDEETTNRLIMDFANPSQDGLTVRASRFFNQDVFKGIDGLDGMDEEDDEDDEDDENADSGIDVADKELATSQSHKTVSMESEDPATSPGISSDSDESHEWADDDAGDDIEEVKHDESAWERDDVPMKNGRPDIDIITEQAMTLAHELATGKRTKHDLLDDSFNRYSHRDVDGLPDWFLDDENKHSKLQRPISAQAAAAIKEKMRALNARPIKKVREAKARKKFKAAQRLEKLKKKSALLADEEGMTEKDKAQSIARLMSRAAKKKPKQKVTVVVAKGGNNGIKGRPKGTKGKYKMVDPRLKKDVRAEKRLAKKRK